jgi:hypothetical protein
MAGHTGPFKVNAYTWGIQFDFDQGKVARIEPYQPGPEGEEKDQVRFPYLTFLQAVMGRRTADDIGQVYADCGPSDEARALCNVLFPRRPSFVLPVA